MGVLTSRAAGTCLAGHECPKIFSWRHPAGLIPASREIWRITQADARLLLVVDNPPTNPFVDHLPSRDGLQHMGDDGDSVDEEDCGTRTNKNDKKDSTEGTHDA